MAKALICDRCHKVIKIAVGTEYSSISMVKTKCSRTGPDFGFLPDADFIAELCEECSELVHAAIFDYPNTSIVTNR